MWQPASGPTAALLPRSGRCPTLFRGGPPLRVALNEGTTGYGSSLWQPCFCVLAAVFIPCPTIADETTYVYQTTCFGGITLYLWLSGDGFDCVVYGAGMEDNGVYTV